MEYRIFIIKRKGCLDVKKSKKRKRLDTNFDTNFDTNLETNLETNIINAPKETNKADETSKADETNKSNEAFCIIPDSDIESALLSCFEANGTLIVYPRGSSMLPALKEGRDSVELSPAFKLSINHIYFYKRPNGRYVLHRLLKIQNEIFIFSGDNQLVVEKVKKEQILACVSMVYKNQKPKNALGCGKIFLYLNSKKLFRTFFIRLRRIKKLFFE